MRRLLYYAIALVTFAVAGCVERSRTYPVYTTAPQPMTYYIGPGGSHVPTEPIEVVR